MLGQLNTAAQAAGGSPPIQVIADPRTNSVLLAGNGAVKLQMRALIAHLDTPSAEGGDTLVRSEQVLRDGGRLVTLVGSVPAQICDRRRVVCPATPPWDVKGGLDAVAPLIAAGKVRINIDQTYPLAAIVQAQEHNRSGRTRGKIVVDMGVSTATPRQSP
jgi:hypothetical protein